MGSTVPLRVHPVVFTSSTVFASCLHYTLFLIGLGVTLFHVPQETKDLIWERIAEIQNASGFDTISLRAEPIPNDTDLIPLVGAEPGAEVVPATT